MAQEKVRGLIEVVVDVRQLKKQEKEEIDSYLMCPARWVTTKEPICRLDLSECILKSQEDIQNCPKLQKYILRL